MNTKSEQITLFGQWFSVAGVTRLFLIIGAFNVVFWGFAAMSSSSVNWTSITYGLIYLGLGLLIKYRTRVGLLTGLVFIVADTFFYVYRVIYSALPFSILVLLFHGLIFYVLYKVFTDHNATKASQ